MSARFWLHVHPLLALIAVAMLAYVGQLGFRGRQARRGGAAMLRRHARITPYVYALVLINWMLGVTSVWLGRDDLDLAASGHFKVGCYLVVTLTAALLLSRWIDRVPNGRTIHPLLGALAVLLAGFQLFLGLQIMPK
ncbi:MAG: DUF4079 family protein [Deltaproteobacteria bacterium]|nr:DUF4079 family protein [Deltaproteobacteria bacterium]MBI3386293.1 DUF4079 family protein [Deltaproteobacteria bacterium]